MPLRDLKISELCSVSQAADPVPGSGGISAVIGMLAASMAETVARLTMEQQEAPTPEMVEAVRELHALRMDLLDAADRDEAAMAELRGSEQMPAGGDMEREFRDRRLSRAGKAAVEVPVYTARLALEVFPLVTMLARKAPSGAAVDAVVSALAASAAAIGCCLNARHRLYSVADRAYAMEKQNEIHDIEREVKTLEMQVIKHNRRMFS